MAYGGGVKSQADLEHALIELIQAHYYSEDFELLSSVRAYQESLALAERDELRAVVLRRLFAEGSMVDILLCSVVDVPSAGPVERPRGALPAQMIGDGTILPVEIRNVTAAALIVSCASTIPAFAPVILRAADAITGVEYALPCKVLWVHRGAPTIVALVVDGIPTRAVFAGIPEPRMSMPLALGKHQRLVG